MTPENDPKTPESDAVALEVFADRLLSAFGALERRVIDLEAVNIERLGQVRTLSVAGLALQHELALLKDLNTTAFARIFDALTKLGVDPDVIRVAIPPTDTRAN